jgi:hypothetical protein
MHTVAETPSRREIKGWMRANLPTHIDQCNEVDCTGLAEAAAYHFDAVQDDGQIGEIYYEAAFEVSQLHESR